MFFTFQIGKMTFRNVFSTYVPSEIILRRVCDIRDYLRDFRFIFSSCSFRGVCHLPYKKRSDIFGVFSSSVPSEISFYIISKTIVMFPPDFTDLLALAIFEVCYS